MSAVVRGTGAQAMVLAAGRGERMRPLTDTCPKPLLEVRGKPLMQYHLEALAEAGIAELVVNTAWLGKQIEARFGERPVFDPAPAGAQAPARSEASATALATGGAPSRSQLTICYSHEGRDFGGPIETAGGIARALPMLAEHFWLVAGDVFMPDFRFSVAALERFAAGGKLAHLFLVPNPPHNPNGDFGLRDDGIALSRAEVLYTYSTVALLHRKLFASLPAGNPAGVHAKLAPLLRQAMADEQVTAELYTGGWTDVGTPERLAALQG